MHAEKQGSVELATDLTMAWLSNPNVRAAAEEVPAFLRQIHAAIEDLSARNPEEGTTHPTDDGQQDHKPAVSVRRSLASSEHIISMIDGKPYKTLRRHLASYGLTPEEYRARYNLKPDYPMVAPSYSEQRRAVAKQLGLGRHGRPKPKTPDAQRRSVGTSPVGSRARSDTKTSQRGSSAKSQQVKPGGRARRPR